MLLTRDEMRFDFRGAKFDPEKDREILRWMLSQFLYGEVTGIQVGHWIYAAPDLHSARFLAKQALEELQHVGSFVKIMELLGVAPERAHPVLRFLATGMMGSDWAEHVAIEMATGEGFVLTAFYAMIDTLDHPEAVSILERAARQEEGHVDFGERQCMKLLAERPRLRGPLLGANLVWMWGVQRLASFIDKRMPREHPVLSQLGLFLAHALRCAELRIERLGLCHGPLRELSSARKAAALVELSASKLGSSAARVARAPLTLLPFVSGQARLTDTYLTDPTVHAADHDAPRARRRREPKGGPRLAN